MVMATSNVAWGCHEMRQRQRQRQRQQQQQQLGRRRRHGRPPHDAAKHAAWSAFAGTIVATNATLFVHALVKLSAAEQQEDQ